MQREKWPFLFKWIGTHIQSMLCICLHFSFTMTIISHLLPSSKGLILHRQSTTQFLNINFYLVLTPVEHFWILSSLFSVFFFFFKLKGSSLETSIWLKGGKIIKLNHSPTLYIVFHVSFHSFAFKTLAPPDSQAAHSKSSHLLFALMHHCLFLIRL